MYAVHSRFLFAEDGHLDGPVPSRVDVNDPDHPDNIEWLAGRSVRNDFPLTFQRETAKKIRFHLDSVFPMVYFYCQLPNRGIATRHSSTGRGRRLDESLIFRGTPMRGVFVCGAVKENAAQLARDARDEGRPLAMAVEEMCEVRYELQEPSTNLTPADFDEWSSATLIVHLAS